jgi:hypothetical protein
LQNTNSSPDSSPSAHPAAVPNLQPAIRRRAEEIYIRSGRIPGRDAENWAQAEREILLEAQSPGRRAAVVIQVNGVQYVGEYQKSSAEGYVPGEFPPGAPVWVRFNDGKMIVKRPNGREMETMIVKKIG